MKALFKNILILSFVSGCCASNLDFQAEVVSMTKLHSDLPLKQGKLVSASFCEMDKPIVDKDSQEVGLYDQVIYKAQQKAKADFLMNIKIYRKCNCVELKGYAGLSK